MKKEDVIVALGDTRRRLRVMLFNSEDVIVAIRAIQEDNYV